MYIQNDKFLNKSYTNDMYSYRYVYAYTNHFYVCKATGPHLFIIY